MTLVDLKRTLVHLFAILLSTLIYCSLTVYNGFPFTFNNDTAVYIERGFSGEARPDRPIAYGLFIAATSLKYSLWLVVIFQAFIVSWITYLLFRYSNSKRQANGGYQFLFWYLGFTMFVCLFTGVSCEVGMLMPDIFTAVTILCMALIVFFRMSKLHLIFVSLILILSIIVHNSHFFICIVLCCFFLAGYIFSRIRVVYKEAGIKLKTICFVVALSVFSNLVTAGIHKHYGAGFKSSFGGSVFFMGNLIEMGVMDSYLSENCGKKKLKLCQYRDSIPNDFLWSHRSPLGKIGGWDKSNESEFSSIEKDLLASPSYLKNIIYKSSIYTIKQFFNFDMVHVQKPTKFVNYTIRTYYLDDYDTHMNSLQASQGIELGFINFSQHLVAGICCLFYCLVFFYFKADQNLLCLTLFILMALIVNAWFCSTFSGVFSRYQTRVVWLLPIPLFAILNSFGLKLFVKRNRRAVSFTS